MSKLQIEGRLVGTTAESVDYANSGMSNVNNAKGAIDNLHSRVAELEQDGGGSSGDGTINVQGTWVSLGTSISWLDTSGSSNVTKGYQSCVRDVIKFSGYVNRAVSGAIITNGFNQIDNLDESVTPDFVTIEFGTNDFGLSGKAWLGAFADFKNASLAENASFTRAYRALIERIYTRNPYAKIILCTPRKVDGTAGSGNWGEYWYSPKGSSGNEFYQQDYADMIRQIGEYMSLPVCDWFAECQVNDINRALYSYDSHIHPNNAGMAMMAKVLIETFKKVI